MSSIDLVSSDYSKFSWAPRASTSLSSRIKSVAKQVGGLHSHLPSILVASFIKRLARLSLSAPPAAIVMIIPFIYNLLKLHPGCMVLIHRVAARDEQGDDVKADVSNGMSFFLARSLF